MRVVLQRVSSASVRVDGNVIGDIGPGLVLLIGIHRNDTDEDMHYVMDKCVHLRIFIDETGKMNHSVLDMGGELLVVSQFTLYGDTRKPDSIRPAVLIWRSLCMKGLLRGSEIMVCR